MILGRVLYTTLRWCARITTNLMFFYKNGQWRADKAQETEKMFSVLIGYVFPNFTLIWILLVAVQ